uniref:4-hydroxy-7-methoxy-3-oxo-3,4-dihydro-2H-1,4-benzoxazin-2-yl glucosidebeta-D-glucosidase n=1 Tax=Oryza barthii TaxID=65489 RepID=A0A0D3EVD7_9ORYZ
MGAAAAAGFFFVLLFLSVQGGAVGYTRSDFPRDFVFGAATSAYQYEGAAAEDGRSPTIWDTFAHEGKTKDKGIGDVAADGYHKYKVHDGRGAVNQEELKYYNNVIDELAKRGIQPHIMLCHLDLPQALEDEYDGWLSPRIVEFGDRVLHWTTLAEPNIAALGGYDTGVLSPGHCSDPFGLTECTVGNSTVEPYIAAHNMILTHAAVVRLYREKYQALQKGIVGINMFSLWSYPLTNSIADLQAAQRYKDFSYGCQVQTELIKGAIDFIGINHYYSAYVNYRPLVEGVRDYVADRSVSARVYKTDPPTEKYEPTEYPNDPKGLQLALEYLRESYGDFPFYIEENGKGSTNDSLDDPDRVDYIKGYIGGVLDAIRNGVDVRGYFVWSFVDVFELLEGYQSRFGLYRVDFDDGARPRRARRSARWYSDFLKGKKDPVLIAPQ